MNVSSALCTGYGLVHRQYPLNSSLESIAFVVGFTLIFFVLIRVGVIASLLVIVAGLNLIVISPYKILIVVEHVAHEI